MAMVKIISITIQLGLIVRIIIVMGAANVKVIVIRKIVAIMMIDGCYAVCLDN